MVDGMLKEMLLDDVGKLRAEWNSIEGQIADWVQTQVARALGGRGPTSSTAVVGDPDMDDAQPAQPA